MLKTLQNKELLQKQYFPPSFEVEYDELSKVLEDSFTLVVKICL